MDQNINQNEQYLVTVDSTGHQVGQAVPYVPTTITQYATSTVYIQGFHADYWLGGLIVIIIISAFFSLFTVKQQTVKIIQRFGKFKKMATAGLSFKVPFIDKIAGEVDLRNQQLTATVETKTKDNVFVQIQVATQYYIDATKADTAFYKLDNVKNQMMSYVFDTVRAQVPKLILDEVFEKKDDIAMAIKSELSTTMSGFGFEMVTSLVTAIEPDQTVKDSMNQINAQTRLRDAAAQKGEGDKIVIIKKAEADAESKRLEGMGIANQRKEIIEGLKISAQDLASATGIDKNEVMNLIMLTQYFDTLKELGSQKVLFVNPSPSGIKDLSEQIKNAVITANEVK